jgi:membrane-bound lytic murein transglycosylase A
LRTFYGGLGYFWLKFPDSFEFVSRTALGASGSSPYLRPENMVHQMMPMKINPAPRASSNSNSMRRLLACGYRVLIVGTLLAAGALTACASAPADGAGIIQQARSRWVPVSWAELPGLGEDPLFEAWNAWLKSCEKPVAPFAALCAEVRRLSIGSPEEQLGWMQQRLQPYRVESVQGESTGVLTGYFEPILEASRTPANGFAVPLYRAPAGLAQRKPWFTRQEIDTVPEVQAALAGREIVYLADPVDAMMLHVQGSGRIYITQPDGSPRWLRLAYAGTNDQPFKSAPRWLLGQGLVRDASWPGVKAWLAQNPQRLQELTWINPRMVFFKEEPLSDLDAAFGPRGAQGVALTPGRSIAVDPGSIPYGTPVWLVSNGAQANLQKLVLAQDTGSAITGAVRADYFAGWGPQAGELAGRLKQSLQLWVLWPK